MFGSVEPSPAALIRAAFDLFESCGLNTYTKKDTTLTGGVFFGGDNRTRTCDLMRVKHAL